MNKPIHARNSSTKIFKTYTLIIPMLLVVIWIACEAFLSHGGILIFRPTFIVVLGFFSFSIILKKNVGDNLFGELGFLYLALAVAYTVIPAFGFMAIELGMGTAWVPEKLTRLLPSASALGAHLWRHVIFVLGVAAGYLMSRGHRKISVCIGNDPKSDDGPMIVFLFGMIVICLLSLSLLSAPVTTYIDNYTRYDHLSWILRKFISLCVRLKIGIYAVLLTFLFLNFKKYKLIIPFVVGFLCVYEVVFSFGSRIEALIIWLPSLCLYNNSVMAISVKKGLIAFVLIAALFTGVEVFRAVGFEVSAAQNAVAADGVKPASEFTAVYFTGFHLYAERSQGTLPDREWPMLFSDFVSLFTFADFTQWNPQYWYARHYFPEAVVPPETMGPNAESSHRGG